MDRGDVVVVVPVYGARELFEECLRSVVAHTTPGTRVVVADDAEPGPGDPAFTERSRRTRRSSWTYVRRAAEPRLRRQHERGVPRHRAGRRGDRQLRHRRAPRVAGAPARGGVQRRPRGDREHAHQPRHDPLGPRLEAPVAASRRRACRSTEADALHRARLAAAAPAHPDRRRALPLHPPLGARAGRRLRRGVLARLRRGGRLLPALPRARAAPRRRRRPLRLPPRRGPRSAARARSARSATRTSSTAATRTTRRRCWRPRRPRRSRSRARSPPPGSRSASCR